MGQAIALGGRCASAGNGNLPDGRIGPHPQVRRWARTSIITHALKHTRLNGILDLPGFRIGIRPEPFDKVLVAEALVEGHKTHSLSGHKAVEPHL
ncbi:hypothetical protein D9M68_901110 [compost metagenome]